MKTMEYLEALKSGACACGAGKASKKAFCFLCFRELPADIKAGLYCRIGDGYEDAYNAALETLREKGRVA